MPDREATPRIRRAVVSVWSRHFPIKGQTRLLQTTGQGGKATSALLVADIDFLPP